MVKLHQQSQSILTGHLFKKFYGGFEPNILIWLPYDDEDNDLTLPFRFRFETGCSDPKATSIFKCIIKPCALPAKFRHGHGKTSSSSHPENMQTYEFYNPKFCISAIWFGSIIPLAVLFQHLKAEGRN